MNNTYFFGDPHFFHTNIIKYCDRPFKDANEMNETIIERWNKVVKDSDQVFVVGDFALCSKENLVLVGKRLKGRKVLILGNHDQASLDTYYKAGFEWVSKYPIIFQEYYIVSHYPAFVEPDGALANIYAHVHNNPSYKDVSARSFCVSAERINYTPISFEDIVKKMQEQESWDAIIKKVDKLYT